MFILECAGNIPIITRPSIPSRMGLQFGCWLKSVPEQQIIRNALQAQQSANIAMFILKYLCTAEAFNKKHRKNCEKLP